jgi:hypothetical protein
VGRGPEFIDTCGWRIIPALIPSKIEEDMFGMLLYWRFMYGKPQKTKMRVLSFGVIVKRESLATEVLRALISG